MKPDSSHNIMVSVCVQTYQHKDFIEQCLNSIINQKVNFKYEIILGEDESTDGTRDICKKYEADYPDKIKLFLRSRKDVIKINGKPTGRYNLRENLKACKGKYIAICEGDDYWTDEFKLQKQVDFLESGPDYSVCFHKVQVSSNNKLVDDYITKVPSETTTIIDLARGNYIHTPSVMFRNQITLPDWFDTIPAADYALHLLSAQNGKLFCMNDVMAVYRVHAGGLWSANTDEQNQLKWIQGLNILCDYFDGEAGAVLAEQRIDWAIVLYDKGYHSETEEILKDAYPYLMRKNKQLRDELQKHITDYTYLSNQVSGTFLIKALLEKISAKFKS